MERMKTAFPKRVKSFFWRAGAYVALAICAYTVNISDIRDIEWNKLATIFVVTISAYVISEGTKYLNGARR